MRSLFAALIVWAASLVLVTSNAGCRGVRETSTATSTPAPSVTAPPHEPSTVTQTDSTSPPIRFGERLLASDPPLAYRNGEEAGHSSILESLGGGVGVFDYDGDGWLDLCIPCGGGFSDGPSIRGEPTRLLRNEGNWQFRSVGELAIGASAELYTHGVSVGDYDNDGFADFLITGYGAVQLWKNQGDGTFLESSSHAAVTVPSWCTSAAWGDLTGDGNLDLYICCYVNWSFENHPVCRGPAPGDREICPPRTFAPLDDMVFFSNGDGTFREATVEAGLTSGGKGLGVVMCDLDDDRDLDVYVANDTTENFLYMNRGDGRLDEVGTLAGAAVDHQGIPNGSMGVDASDFNHDGRPDLWVTNYEREPFGMYRNEGDGQFLHVSQSTGISALGGKYVGFGTAFVDLDRDGFEELVVTNGHVIKFPRFAPRRQPPVVMAYQAGHFHKIEFPPGGYLSNSHEGRGLAVGDFDGDGSQDVLITHLNEPPMLLDNETRDANSWLRLRLIGVVSNRDAVGTLLTLHTSEGEFVRCVKGGSSYLSHPDGRVFWGVRRGVEVIKVSIRWPSGVTQTLTSPTVNLTHVVVEPEASS